MEPQTPAFWSRPAAELLAGLETTPAGLSAAEAASRLTRYASRHLVPKKRTDAATLLLGQFSSPIVLLLLSGDWNHQDQPLPTPAAVPGQRRS
jgi:hypothetical protein